MITVIDSGIANIGSVLSACRGIRVATWVTARAVASAEAVILLGIGAFANGMDSLRRRDLIGPIRDAAAAGTPILGVCLHRSSRVRRVCCVNETCLASRLLSAEKKK